jgi:hypothetical protein
MDLLHLFDPEPYGEETQRRRRERQGVDVEPFTEPWLLLANRGGVVGFHIPLHIDPKLSTVYSLCGLQGHVVEPPTSMVRCSECEKIHTSSP